MVKKSPAFMKHKILSPLSQKPAIVPRSEPDKSSAKHLYIVSLKSILMLSSPLCLGLSQAFYPF